MIEIQILLNVRPDKMDEVMSLLYEDRTTRFLVFNIHLLDKLAILEYRINIEERLFETNKWLEKILSGKFKKKFDDGLALQLKERIAYDMKTLRYLNAVYDITRNNSKLYRITGGIDHINYAQFLEYFLDANKTPFPEGIEVIVEKINLNEELVDRI